MYGLKPVPFTGSSFSAACKSPIDSFGLTGILRLRSEFVTFLNLRDLLAHKSFVFSTEFRVKTKKSQALRTGLEVVSCCKAPRTGSDRTLDATMSTPSKATPSQGRSQSLTGVRLRKHADYQRAYAAARKRQSASMSWFLAPQSPAYAGAQPPSGPRVGLTAGKVLGKSHERNRIKRLMREVLRHHVDLLPQGFDLIFHPRRYVLDIEFAKLEAEVVRILHQANAEVRRMAVTPQGLKLT
jgi:ribonuclease P protein component